jgi:hypothetical protein
MTRLLEDWLDLITSLALRRSARTSTQELAGVA